MKPSETEIAIVTMKGRTFATANQILAWKEKAEKWDQLQIVIQGTPHNDKSQFVKNAILNDKIIERLKKEVEEIYSVCDALDDFESGKSIKEKLQKILEEWTDKHTKIAQESNERFKSHTKDEEVDI